MSLNSAKIILGNQWNTYYAGQDVLGKVEYTFDAPIKIKGVSVQFKGEAKTFWSESKREKDSSGREVNVTHEHSGREEYFQITYYLIGSKNGPDLDIPAGTVSYDLRCALPPSLPSSFEGEFGFIRYTAETTIETDANIDKKAAITFTVINNLDLNTNPSYKEPIHFQLEKTFCCCCCKSAPLSIDIRAPVSGYCSGQAIPFNVNIENHSNVQVHLVKILFRKIAAFRVTEPKAGKKVLKNIIAEVKEGPVPAGQNKEFKLELQIPPTPPSNLVNCSIIDLDYDIKVIVEVSGMHFNPKAKKYVTIGTVPLVGIPQTSEDQKPSAPSFEGDLPPSDPGWQASPNHLYPSLSDPTFQEMSRDDAQNEVPAVFAPRYPVYSMPVPKQ